MAEKPRSSVKTLRAWAAEPSTSPAAHICGARLPPRTYPEIAPDTAPEAVPEHAGRAPLMMMTTRNLSFWNISAHHLQEPGSILLHGEGCRGIHSLLGKVVVHFDLDLVQARLQIRGGKRLLQRNLVAHVAHGVGRLDGMDDCLVVDVVHIVLDRGRRLVRLLVHAEIVNLHPEIQFLITLERDWLAIGRRDARPHLCGPDHEIAGAYVLGRHWLHLVGDDEG